MADPGISELGVQSWHVRIQDCFQVDAPSHIPYTYNLYFICSGEENNFENIIVNTETWLQLMFMRGMWLKFTKYKPPKKFQTRVCECVQALDLPLEVIISPLTDNEFLVSCRLLLLL